MTDGREPETPIDPIEKAFFRCINCGLERSTIEEFTYRWDSTLGTRDCRERLAQDDVGEYRPSPCGAEPAHVILLDDSNPSRYLVAFIDYRLFTINTDALAVKGLPEIGASRKSGGGVELLSRRTPTVISRQMSEVRCYWESITRSATNSALSERMPMVILGARQLGTEVKIEAILDTMRRHLDAGIPIPESLVAELAELNSRGPA